jgi:hypothetical protein
MNFARSLAAFKNKSISEHIRNNIRRAKKRRVSPASGNRKSLRIAGPYHNRKFLYENTIGLNELTRAVYNASSNKRVKIIRLLYKNGSFWRHVSSRFKKNTINKKIDWRPLFTHDMKPDVTYFFQVGLYNYFPGRNSIHSKHAVSAVKRGQTLYFVDSLGNRRSLMSDIAASHLKRALRASRLIMYKGVDLQANNKKAICVGLSFGILRFLSKKLSGNWKNGNVNQPTLNRVISQFGGSSEAECNVLNRHLTTNNASVRYPK